MTTEENLERLCDAGFLVEDIIPVCFNCNTKGHGKSECPRPLEGSFLGQELTAEKQRTVPLVVCINCGEEGHRMRDCTKERNEFTAAMTCRTCQSALPLPDLN